MSLSFKNLQNASLNRKFICA